MKLVIIDGQSGRMGALLAERIKAAKLPCEVLAVGTNAIATAAMMKAGADQGATGENPVLVACRTADVIAGPIGILSADALLGEITPAMAVAVGQSPAKKLLLPVNRNCGHTVVGVRDLTLSHRRRKSHFPRVLRRHPPQHGTSERNLTLSTGKTQEDKIMNISITKNTHPGELIPSNKLGFGVYYTDHMFIMDYSEEKGWHDARIVPFQNITLSPAACVFHYGAEVFEGLKAYRRKDGKVQLFRPWDNMERMKNSAIRLGLPVVPPEDALEAVKALVKIDERFVPSEPGTSLYIRPFLFGTDPKLGLHGVHEAMFVVILSPVGSYFENGMEPVKIVVETEDVRAVRGGTGEAKCGGNYGASNRAGERAFANGYSQVLWLDGVEHKYVEEGGGMNVVFKIDGKIITPMLTGSILPGVTRRSCIQLFKDWGMPVEERLISVDELFEAAASGKLEEAMCVGTDFTVRRSN